VPPVGLLSATYLTARTQVATAERHLWFKSMERNPLSAKNQTL